MLVLESIIIWIMEDVKKSKQNIKLVRVQNSLVSKTCFENFVPFILISIRKICLADSLAEKTTFLWVSRLMISRTYFKAVGKIL